MRNYKLLIIVFLLIYACTPKNINTVNKVEIQSGVKFSNIGFALLYDQDLKKKRIINKKIDERTLIIFQKNLKKNTNVKITNLINNKSILAKVGSRAIYPNFYNSVISKRIFEELELNINEPYVQIVSIANNDSFFAKKTKMYDEEKQVADKAPVDGISISNLSSKNNNKIIIKENDNFNYIIKIGDFYYKESATQLKKRIIDEFNIKNIKITKISPTNYRVFLGPIKNLKSLKKAFDDITPLNFENIEIIKL